MPPRKNDRIAEIVPLPARMTIAEDGTSLRLTRRWLDRSILASIVLAVVTNVVLLRMLNPSLFGTEPVEPSEPVMIILVAVLALFFVITTITSLINHSLIVANADEILVKNGPLPLPGRRFDRSEVAKVYVRSRVDSSPERWGPAVSYEVRVTLGRGKDKKDRKLVSQIYIETQARFIEQEIKRFLQL
jgi:hypothetical protein